MPEIPWVNERRKVRFTHDLASTKQETIPLNLPLCGTCGGYGFTGAPLAFGPDRFGNKPLRGGYFAAIAWRDGVACLCPVGREFAREQCEWIGGNA
jgi:hypothetical protein